MHPRPSRGPPWTSEVGCGGLASNNMRSNLDLAPNLPIGIVRHADAARLGNALQPRGDVDAVAENVVVIKNDVTDML
jgi:hypothetical protein